MIDVYLFFMEESNLDDFFDYKLEGEGEDYKDMFFLEMEELEEGEISN